MNMQKTDSQELVEQVCYQYFDGVLSYAESKEQLVEIVGDENEASIILLGAKWYDCHGKDREGIRSYAFR